MPGHTALVKVDLRVTPKVTPPIVQEPLLLDKAKLVPSQTMIKRHISLLSSMLLMTMVELHLPRRSQCIFQAPRELPTSQVSNHQVLIRLLTPALSQSPKIL